MAILALAGASGTAAWTRTVQSRLTSTVAGLAGVVGSGDAPLLSDLIVNDAGYPVDVQPNPVRVDRLVNADVVVLDPLDIQTADEEVVNTSNRDGSARPEIGRFSLRRRNAVRSDATIRRHTVSTIEAACGAQSGKEHRLLSSGSRAGTVDCVTGNLMDGLRSLLDIVVAGVLLGAPLAAGLHIRSMVAGLGILALVLLLVILVASIEFVAEDAIGFVALALTLEVVLWGIGRAIRGLRSRGRARTV